MLTRGLLAAAGPFGLYLLLPLIGWWLGGGDGASPWNANLVSSFLAEPARGLYLAAAAIQVPVTAILSARLPGNRPLYLAKPGAIHWSHIALETILVIGPYSDRRGTLVMEPSAALRWVGFGLFGLGMALAVWAGYLRSRQIARQELAPSAPVLLVEGPYRRLRYPHYLGLIGLALGAAFIFRSWFGFGAALFLFNFVIMRLNQDEQSARKKYGIRWTAYARRSWRLLPFIY